MVQLVNLPRPTPIGQPGQKREVPAIPDDILREVVSYLPVKTRAAVSVVSKHVHDVLSILPLDIEGHSPAQVARLHDYIFQDPARPSSIRSISFSHRLVVMNAAEWDTCTAQAVEIIQAARRLHELTFTSNICSTLLPQHMSALTQLVHLTVHLTPDQMLTRDLLPRTLQTITLRRNKTARASILASELLKTLSRLPLLHTITLIGLSLKPDPADDQDFDDDDDLDDGEGEGEGEDEDEGLGSDEGSDEEGEEVDEGDENGTEDEDDEDIMDDVDGPTVLPAVHTLTMNETDLPSATCIRELFPNLRTLELENSLFPEDGSSKSPEKPLHHLILRYPPTTSRVPWSGVSRLTFAKAVSEWASEEFFDLCDTATLVSLTLESISASNFEMPVWSEETWFETRKLHLLEIESMESCLMELVNNLAEWFRGETYSPLMCLSLLGDRSNVSREEEDECRMALFDSAVKNVPSLRYIALAEVSLARNASETNFSGTRAPWRWWKIVRDSDEDGNESGEDSDEGTSARVVEIPAWEGERVRAFLRNADLKTAERFDELFTALR